MANATGWWKQLDDLLRGNKSRPELMAMGTEHLPVMPFLALSILLAVVYGLFMGMFAVVVHDPPMPEQLLAAALKVPALFYLTLFVTFPSLYVFSALRGSKLGPLAALRVIVAAMAVTITVLASVGPIMGFFTLTTDSYPFIKLLNVLFFTAAGFIGLKFLATLLQRLERAEMLRNAPPPAPAPVETVPEPPAAPVPPPLLSQTPPFAPPTPAERQAALSAIRASAPPRYPAREEHLYSHGVFRVWVILYAVVGAQMAWVLRPFIGMPGQPFEVFRERQSNIFVNVLQTIGDLLGS